MTFAAQLAALVVLGANALVAVVGAWCWWTFRPSRVFWALCRCGQGIAMALAITAGVLAIAGHDPDDGLFWLYALLPVAVSFVAEQLRALAAQSVLDARGLADARAVGQLDETGQRSVVLAIVRREIGTMTLAALVIVFLALRAWGTA